MKADKGNTTVALNEGQYLNKRYELLSEQNTYVLINKYPTITIQNKLNKLIDNCVKTTMLHEKKEKT